MAALSKNMATGESLEAGDPGGPIQLEVERGVTAMVEQHSAWLELCAIGQRGEEFDWRSAELLSCLRAIEWDLQDLEDAVSIVEGNRKKFSLDDDAVKGRKGYIEDVRGKIENIRSSVQDAAHNDGHAAAKKGLGAKMGAPNKYNKLSKEQAESVAEGSLPGTPKGSSDVGDSSGVHGAGVSGGADTEIPRQRARAWWACCC